MLQFGGASRLSQSPVFLAKCFSLSMIAFNHLLAFLRKVVLFWLFFISFPCISVLVR